MFHLRRAPASMAVRLWWAGLLAGFTTLISGVAHSLTAGSMPHIGWLAASALLCWPLAWPLVHQHTRWWDFFGGLAVLQVITQGIWWHLSDPTSGTTGAVTPSLLAHAVGTIVVAGLCSVAEAVRTTVHRWGSLATVGRQRFIPRPTTWLAVPHVVAPTARDTWWRVNKDRGPPALGAFA